MSSKGMSAAHCDIQISFKELLSMWMKMDLLSAVFEADFET